MKITVIAGARKGIAYIAAASFKSQRIFPVRLFESYHVHIGIIITPHAFLDMIDQQSFTGKSIIKSCFLTVFHQPVFPTAVGTLKFICYGIIFYLRDLGIEYIRCYIDRTDETDIVLTPRIKMRRLFGTAVVVARCHHRPRAQSH